MDIIIPSPFTETDGPHPRPECSPTRCPMCNFPQLAGVSGDGDIILHRIITFQKIIEEIHDMIHKAVQQLYGLRWSLKSHPRPAGTLLPLTIFDKYVMVMASDVAAVEDSVRFALRMSLRDHRELEIRRRELVLVLLGRAEKPQWLLELTESKASAQEVKKASNGSSKEG